MGDHWGDKRAGWGTANCERYVHNGEGFSGHQPSPQGLPDCPPTLACCGCCFLLRCWVAPATSAIIRWSNCTETTAST